MIAVPFVWLLVRDKPKQVVDLTDEANSVDLGITLKEAINTSTFWKLGGVFLLISVAIIGLVPSFIPLLQDAGMTPQQAGGYAAYLGLSVMIGRLLTGFLIDRFFAPYVLAGVFLFVASGCLSLGFGGTTYALWAAIALGLAIGAEVDLISYFTAKYFGLQHYGSIYGVMYSIFSLGAIISPVIAGAIWDRTGSYDWALFLAVFLILVAVVLSLFLPRFSDQA